MLMDWLNRLAVPYQIILTKIDKTKKLELDALKEEMTAELKKNAAAVPDLIPTSVETGAGIDILRGIVASLRRSS